MKTERTARIMSFMTLTGIVFFGMGLLLFPLETSKSCVNGIELCMNAVFPSLFPFFVTSSMLINTGAVERLAHLLAPVGKALFGISGKGFSAFLVGCIGGYPVGVRTAVTLFETGHIGKRECQRLLLFCNNAGPAFILGVVGVGLLKSRELGLILYFAHIISALIIGLLLSRLSGEPFEEKAQTKPEAMAFVPSFISSVTGAMSSMLNICAFVIFFGVFVTVLEKSGITHTVSSLITYIFGDFLAEKGLLNGIITGFFELTGGISALSGADMLYAVITSGFLLGWAGMSIHFQAMTFISKAGLSSSPYFFAKLCQGALSSFLLWLCFKIFPVTSAVFHYDYPYYYGLDPELYARFLRGNLILTGFFIVFSLICYFSIVFFEKTRYNKEKERGELSCFTEKE